MEVFSKMISDMMIKPGGSPVFGNPGDFGLAYEDVTFKASDGVTLSGWLIKGGTEKIIIQSHFGVQSSRSGFTPDGKGMIKLWKKNIPFLQHARSLVEQGYSMLMYDFRNHGNSETGTCPWVSWGPEEHKDVIAAVDFVSRHPTYKGSNIGLLSICMGAAATTYAYGVENGLQNYTNIKAMIAIQPLLYADFVQALGIPGFLNKGASKVNLKRTGIDLDKTSFVPNVRNIKVPTLVIQNKNDPWANLDAVQEYYDELCVEKELLWLELSKGRAAAYDEMGKSPKMLTEFFEKHL